jgi:hypothetical protein
MFRVPSLSVAVTRVERERERERANSRMMMPAVAHLRPLLDKMSEGDLILPEYGQKSSRPMQVDGDSVKCISDL